MKRTTIGGQALIEGLMMIGPENSAIAIRKADGEIIVESKPLSKKSVFSKIPILRGAVNLVRQLVLGMKALMYSVEFVELEDDKKAKPSKIDKFLEKILGDKLGDGAIYFSVVFALAFCIGLFILIPNIIAGFMNFNKEAASGVIFYNLFEGLIRIILFFGYVVLASMMKDIKRIWEYHGAEHKTIHCYEHEEELTVENIKKYTTKHPRCGTSFMFLVMIVSILVFSFLGWNSIWINVLSRLLLMPLVAGISYEILKLAGRSNLKIMGVISAPGMFFQCFTTKEPDDSQIEVAIAAFNGVRVDNREADKW